MKREPLTTGEIAELCHVTKRAVHKWVAEAKLKAYKTPGNHSRVEVGDFLNFLRKYHMPIPAGFKPEDQKAKVLIVDDDKEVVNLLRKLLEIEDKYAVKTAYDGFAAGRTFCEFRPDIVLLDINLPGLDGFEVCKQIKSNPANRNTKILAVSGEMTKEIGEKMLELGANDYIAKPFDNNVIKAKIDILLGLTSKREEEQTEDYDDDRR